jgi:membrane-bound metal-dependent hydrolase YbcI (DUF457 family)
VALAKEHLVIGGLAGIGVYALQKWTQKESWTIGGTIASFSWGAFFGVLADQLEPALNNPHHRQVFHSLILLIGILAAYNKIGGNDFQKLAVNIGMGGYASHLFLDSLTPQSLPFI